MAHCYLSPDFPQVASKDFLHCFLIVVCYFEVVTRKSQCLVENCQISKDHYFHSKLQVCSFRTILFIQDNFECHFLILLSITVIFFLSLRKLRWSRIQLKQTRTHVDYLCLFLYIFCLFTYVLILKYVCILLAYTYIDSFHKHNLIC